MQQREYRMPASGEGWRHYKQGPSLYTIVGMSHHENTGEPIVVYTEACWSLVQPPPLYTRPLADFLAMIDTGKPEFPGSEKTRKVQRFVFEREAGHDPRCPFLRIGADLSIRQLENPK